MRKKTIKVPFAQDAGKMTSCDDFWEVDMGSQTVDCYKGEDSFVVCGEKTN